LSTIYLCSAARYGRRPRRRAAGETEKISGSAFGAGQVNRWARRARSRCVPANQRCHTTLGAECVPAQPVLCYNEGRLVEGTTNGTVSLPAPSERPTTSWGR